MAMFCRVQQNSTFKRKAEFLKSANSAVQANLSTAVTTYPLPSGLPNQYKSTAFTVNAGGNPVGLYNAGNNGWGNSVSYGYFDFSGTVSVSITPSSGFSSFKLVPSSLPPMRSRCRRCTSVLTKRSSSVHRQFVLAIIGLSVDIDGILGCNTQLSVPVI